MAVCQNLVPLVNIKIAGKWMFIPLKMVLIGILIHCHIRVTKQLRVLHWILRDPRDPRLNLDALTASANAIPRVSI